MTSRRSHPWLAATLLATALLGAPPAAALDLALLHTYDGQVALADFGLTSAVVGDMDGDGYAEFAIGASADSTPGRSAGRVFVFRGGASHGADPPAWVLDGLPGDFLGFSLAAAGDQDGDGLADLLIGAPGNTDVGPALTGRVLLVYGSSPLGTRAPLVIAGDAPGDRFGESVTVADMNGDSIGDVGVGAPGAASGAGRAKVYRGRTDPAVVLLAINGEAPGDEFGTAVAGAGSTRGGSYGDLLVGAPYNSDFLVWGGKVYLYLGGAVPDAVPDQVWRGADDADLLGQSVGTAGDVNGDGRSDFLLGAPGVNIGFLLDAGRAYLYLGNPVPPATPAVTFSGSLQYGELGLRVSGVGDVNGDGKADFAIGSPGSPDAFTPGDVRVFLGSTAPTSSPDTVLVGEAIDDMFGHSISNGGPVLGGAGDQFLVGGDEHGAAGRVYLYGRTGVAGTREHRAGPAGVRLLAPWPSPAPGALRLAIEVDRSARVRLEIVDVAGRIVATLADRELAAGRHEFRWPAGADGGAPRAGLYWAVLSTTRGTQTRRFALLGP